MQPFLFHSPTKILIGPDTALSIAEIISELNAKTPLIITDSNLRKAGIVEGIISAIKQANLPIHIFDQVPPDSDLESVEKAVQIAKQNHCDIIIAIGGGSVIDTAKVANIGISLSANALDYEGVNTITCKLMPLIAIPTTAGTGSEVSAVAVIKDKKQKSKLLFGSPFLFPDIAILDPQLLISLPPKLTAACGLDALTHSIEALSALTANYISDGLSLNSMLLMFKHLLTTIKDGSNIDTRLATLVASTMAGLAFTNAGVGIVHALSHTIGSRYGTHHGLTNAVFLPYGMQFNLDVAKAKYALAWRSLAAQEMEKYLGNESAITKYIKANKSEADEKEAAQHFINIVKIFIQECGISINLKSIGITNLKDEDILELANIASTDPAIMFNPKEASVQEIAKIIREAY
jgi:alcohol dehydrogenase class IV